MVVYDLERRHGVEGCTQATLSRTTTRLFARCFVINGHALFLSFSWSLFIFLMSVTPFLYLSLSPVSKPQTKGEAKLILCYDTVMKVD